jgi:hypothetical protein
MTARQTTRSDEILDGVGAQAGQKWFSFKHTHVGAADAVLFEDYGLPDMLDKDYRVFLQGEMTESLGDTICVDESTIEETGFSFKGGTASEVSHILVHGNVDE